MVSIFVGVQTGYDKGSYCYDCGLAAYRLNCSVTLAGGWWGVTGVVVPFVLLLNYLELQKLSELPQAVQPRPQQFSFDAATGEMHILPEIVAQTGVPLDAGKPLLHRWTTYLFPVVLLLACGGLAVYSRVA